MESFRVVVANEPRAYREALAATVQALRPGLAMTLAEPEDLDREVVRRAPQLVVCSALSEVVETRVPAWVLLYPNGEDRATSSVAGHRTHLQGVRFKRLLALIDDAIAASPATPPTP